MLSLITKQFSADLRNFQGVVNQLKLANIITSTYVSYHRLSFQNQLLEA